MHDDQHVVVGGLPGEHFHLAGRDIDQGLNPILSAYRDGRADGRAALTLARVRSGGAGRRLDQRVDERGLLGGQHDGDPHLAVAGLLRAAATLSAGTRIRVPAFNR